MPAVRGLYTGAYDLPKLQDGGCQFLFHPVEGKKIASLEEIQHKQILVAVKTGTAFSKDRRTSGQLTTLWFTSSLTLPPNLVPQAIQTAPEQPLAE